MARPAPIPPAVAALLGHYQDTTGARFQATHTPARGFALYRLPLKPGDQPLQTDPAAFARLISFGSFIPLHA